nr:type II toxin-antitoxin system RelE/ParE family toxin [uncultured Desulfobacter sp.]
MVKPKEWAKPTIYQSQKREEITREHRGLAPANLHRDSCQSNTNDIWEVRADVGRDTFRLLGFFDGQELIILTNSFQKKSQKTPKQEIKLAESRKKEYLSRR